MLICGAEDPPHPREMIRIINIHIRVAEVQLQSSAKVESFAQRPTSSSAYGLSGLTLQNPSNR
jgi:hypothetical protein